MLPYDKVITDERTIQTSPTVSAPSLPKVDPSARFYEIYGISGCSTVLTRRGEIALKDMDYNDEMISFSSGFVKPIGVLRSSYRPHAKDAPVSYMICKGSFSDDSPQSDIFVGKKTEVKVSFPREGNKPARLMSPARSAIREVFPSLCSTRPQLHVPVFENRTVVQMHGIYVVCPSMEDLVAECIAA